MGSIVNKFLYNGGLILIWGWVMLLFSFMQYLTRTLFFTTRIRIIMEYAILLLPVLGIILTIMYARNYWAQCRSEKGISILITWLAAMGSMMLINLIQFRVLHQINFEFQHPLFMVITGMAILITGRILHINSIMIGGIVFGILAYLSSFYQLKFQLLIESMGWFMALVIPGHILQFKMINTKV